MTSLEIKLDHVTYAVEKMNVLFDDAIHHVSDSNRVPPIVIGHLAIRFPDVGSEAKQNVFRW